jgi:hypothetical protein
MRLGTVAMFTVVFVLTFTGCKSEPALPPSPTSLINNTRDRLNPFRFTVTTDPTSPSSKGPIMLKVHVIDAANQPADGVTLNADVSMAGMAQHLILSGKGDGDYETQMNLEMPGSWDLDLTATKDGKSSRQQLNIEVGG